MIKDLINRVFALRDAAHLAHWNTKSYAQHVALGDFYDSVIDKLDAIVEAYQGHYGLVGKVTLDAAMRGDIIDHIGKEGAWIAKNREEIAQGNEMLVNMLDDLSALYSTTYYKLRNLS